MEKNMLIRETPESAERGGAGRQGMTLVELVLAMAIFAVMLCAFMHLQFATLEADRVSLLRMNGMVALRSEIEECSASPFNAMENRAQGLLSFLLDEQRENLQLVNNAIVYKFPVPPLGGALNTDGSSPYENAMGTITLFLREDRVPVDFTNWWTSYSGGSTTPNNKGFDMNGNRSMDDDFSSLFNGSEIAIKNSGLNFLPAQGEIQYFNSEADMASGAPAYSVDRYFIISGDSVIQ